MKCNLRDCIREAEVVPILAIPCLMDHECEYEQEVLLGAEVCRICQQIVTIADLLVPEIAIYFTNVMSRAAHEPDFERAHIRWVPLDSEEYAIFKKLKNSSLDIHLDDSGSKLLH